MTIHIPHASARLRHAAVLVALAVAPILTWACVNQPAALTQLVEARGQASALHVTFTRSVDAGNRSLMATDEATAATAANEARNAMVAVARHTEDLQQTLQSLAYHSDLKHLDAFRARFAQYRTISDEVLSLVLENSNGRAQRLSLGASSEAAEAFHKALEAVQAEPAGDPWQARAAASRAWASVLEIRVLYPRHIPEADGDEMTRLETAMAASAAAARAALDDLAKARPSAPGLVTARAALDRFMAVHAEIIDLSRRNSNVRALSIALGQRRTLAAEADDQLNLLEQALAGHEYSATR